ncbi:LamG-like jellyroll fold domain-containing protein [Streptomyces sp. NPDC017082]|uniref:LamG-like jellyroll fold domain-containing protein n=1 Tax=Streptomyces sp. NPDC017082 TaxID=3364974 RepID=UPI00379E65AE
MRGRVLTRRHSRIVALALTLVTAAGTAPAASAAAGLGAVPLRADTAAGTGTGAGPAAPSTTDEALAQARETGKKVEVAALRSESADVYATPDGNLEAREYLRPVRTRVDGAWKPVDTDLSRTAEGTVAPGATTVGLEFSAGGDAPLVRMEKAGRELSLSWPGKLPAPVIDGSTATYRDVLPDVDLRMGAQEDGFTQLLVVKSAEAAASEQLAQLRLKLSADGMDVRENAQGGLEAVDPGAGNAVFEAPRPVMWDSSPGAATAQDTTGRTATRQPAAKTPAVKSASRTATTAKTASLTATATTARTASLTATAAPASTAAPVDEPAAGPGDEPAAGESAKLAPVAVDVPAGDKELVLTPDANVLRGKDTVYPVFIDPQWYSPRASAWTMVSKYWASSPQWKFNGEDNAGLGYCGWYYCKPYDTKRLFYRIPVSKFADKTILEAEFVVRNVWSASCSARSVELWRTKDISSSTTWNSQTASGFWIDKLKTDSFAYGFEGCSAKDAEFDVKSAVQSAANARSATMTFGMQASSETDIYGWKRFSDKAYLRVKYNRPPAQVKMSQLTMEYGGTCKKPEAAARVRTLGKIYANDITDPDGDTIAVEFQAAWDTGDGKGSVARWKPARTGYKKSGSDFVITLPSSIPENKQISWYVRSYDGAQYSPWSYTGDPTSCYFVYDTKVPKAPSVTSSDYPASDPEDPEDPWYDGVGQYGAFTLKAADTDVTKYWFGVNGDPTSANAITTASGAAKVARMLPAKPGLNFVTARAFDTAGNAGEIRTYQFRVKAGQPERASWQLDDAAGSAAAKGQAAERTAELRGGPAPQAEGAKGTAVSFDGTDDYAVTDIPTVDTSGSFSVSAWAKLSALPDHAAVIAAQPGNHSPGFELYYSSSLDRWVFNQYTADSPDAGIVRAMPSVAGGAKAGEWTHLVGTYSSGSDQLSLYVNGTLAGTTAYSTPWNARRGLQIGAGSYNGRPGSFFPGAIDEVQLFDKPLSGGEVTRLYGKDSLIGGRGARARFPMDEPAGATSLTGAAEVPDATFYGGPAAGTQGIAGKALTLDGTDDYASTGRPLLNNQASFAVSAWAKLPKTKPDHAAVVVTQAGVHRPGMELYYSKSYDRWAFNQYASDASDAQPVRALQAEGQTAYGDTWTHLVGVHDTVANKLILYVNGVQAGSTDLQAGWYAGGALQIGAGNYDGAPGSFFPGQIDDVRLFDRPVSADEVRQLFRQRPLLGARWKLDAGDSAAPSPDDAGRASALTLQGGAKIGTGFMDGGLELDGTAGYASAPAVPVDTSASFTVTAWAQAASTPTRNATVVSAEGTSQSPFAVRFVPDPAHPDGLGNWEIALPDKDGTDASTVRLASTEFSSVTDWNHLALVYDGFSKQASLYVNGILQEVPCEDADGDGQADSASCQDLVAWGENVLTAKAGKSFQVGRVKTGSTGAEYFPGLIDDVWVFQGALDDSQVEELAGSWFDVPTEVPAGS